MLFEPVIAYLIGQAGTPLSIQSDRAQIADGSPLIQQSIIRKLTQRNNGGKVMFNTISSRATFYDIIGYLIPGVITEGIGCTYVYTVFGGKTSTAVLMFIANNTLLCSVLIVCVGYCLGHMMNALSSALLEKCLYKEEFKMAKDWYGRVKDSNPTRAAQIADRIQSEYKLEVERLSTFDIRIRMEEMMPCASVTGLSFISFYGMSRTVSLLVVLLIPSCVGIAIRFLSSPICCITSMVICIVLLLIAKLFQYQYIRFVQYYYDFLGSTLLYVPKEK